MLNVKGLFLFLIKLYMLIEIKEQRGSISVYRGFFKSIRKILKY